MKLYHAGPSPFARKVRVVAAELGLTDKIEEVPLNPYDRPDNLMASSPLGKIPCLVLDDGTPLYDSPVICEYLNDLAGGSLIPASGMERFIALRRCALADGVLDQAFNISGEVNRRPENERSPKWIEHWRSSVAAGIDQIGAEIGESTGPIDMVQIGFGVALGYADFRMADMLDWRANNAALAEWYTEFSQRPSMQGTRPDA